MIVHYKNYLEDAILTAQNTPVGQDIYDLKVPHLSQTFSQLNTGAFVGLDLQSAKQIRSVVIDKGNLLLTTTVTLYADDNPSFTSPESFVMTSTDTCYYWMGDKTYRYWKISFTDPTLTSIVIGYIHIGDYLVLPGIDPGAQLTYATTSSRDLSISGQVYGDLGYQYLSTTFDFPYIPENNWIRDGKTVANRKDIINMWNTVQNSQPVWLMIWENSLDVVAPVFCVINQSEIQLTKSQLNWSTSINFLEVK